MRIADRRVRFILLVAWYVVILAGVFIVTSSQGFTPPQFIYQGF
jgi:hypothetical protein